MRFVLFLLTATLSIAGEFTTSLGDTYPYTVSAITTDSAGNTYVVGSRQLGGPTAIAVINGAVPPAIFTSSYGGTDVFVSKLDPNGKLLFTDTFAGKGVDTGTAIALDPSGNIYIAGTTTSSDFPLSKALQTQTSANGTGFIIKLSNDGSTILYSTYFGGTLGATSITSLATDSSGNLFLTGATGAADFPHTTGMPAGPSPLGAGNTGVILASISATGDKIVYAGVLVGGPIPLSGGSPVQSSGGVGVAVDASGNAYFAGNVGNTGGTNLPTTPGVLAPSGSFTGVLAKITAAGLSYLTYLPTLVSALAVDSAGDAYIAGFKTQAINGPYLISVAKINPSATAIVWTNNLEGAAAGIQAIAVDANENVWATGTVASSAFPNTNGWTTGPEFLAGLNATGTKLTYSALFPIGTAAQSVAVDPSGLIHVAGLNGFVSAIAPATAPTMKIFDFQNAAGGNVTARISPAEVIAIFGPGIGPATPATAAPVNGFYPKTLAGVQVTINGMNMPLLYVSANQINAVVPMAIAPGASATIRVINGTAVSPDYPVWILAYAPQAFPPVLNQDGTINSQTNPAKGGSIVTFYATGWQSNFSPLADGQVATVADNACVETCQAFSNTSLNGPVATVLYGGAAPGIVAGVTQFNVHIGTLPSPLGLLAFNFNVAGPSTVSQIVWVAP
jgi:uncharacterized protein (TIGR03437 family)